MRIRIYTAVWSILFIAVAYPSLAGDKGKNAETDRPDKTKLLKLVNDTRAKGCKCGDKYFKPAAPLTWNANLEMAATGHSMYMSEGNYLSHAGLNGNNAGDRIIATGYAWRGYGENIAAGYRTEEEVVKGWINSPGHCKNIMNANFKEMAIARTGIYWTQVLAVKK